MSEYRTAKVSQDKEVMSFVFSAINTLVTDKITLGTRTLIGRGTGERGSINLLPGETCELLILIFS